ncbi:hypothetical protein [Nocardioides pantholopis]|nr:hypothetical protein [Nocardioides pantholopis]
MYNNGSITAGGALAATGLAFDAVWLLLAAFAIISAILAAARILPRLH